MTVKNELTALEKIWEKRRKNHKTNLSQRNGTCAETTPEILAASSVLSDWLKHSPANTREAYAALMTASRVYAVLKSLRLSKPHESHIDVHCGEEIKVKITTAYRS